MEVAIVVSSYDGYADLWSPFFVQFFKYWNPTYKIYLISNQLKYNDSRITTIATGKEISWTSKMRNAIEKINEEIIILFLDDYFIVESVDCEVLEKFLNSFMIDKIDYLRLVNVPKTKIIHNEKKIQEIDKNKLYGANLQLSIWNKSYLRSTLEVGDYSAWQYEESQKNRSSERVPGQLYFSQLYPIKIINGVLQGKWNPKSRNILISDGVFLENQRAIMTKIDCIKNRIRNILKRIIPAKIQVILKPILQKLGFKFVTKG